MRTICFVILGIVSLVIADDFDCDNDDPTIVTFFNKKLVCPKGYVCNSKANLSGTTKPKPCVLPAAICDYSCSVSDKSKVTINGMSLACPDDEECNARKTSCEVCVLKPCDTLAFKCKGETTVEYQGMIFDCPVGQLCNSEYKRPCTPCRAPDNDNSRSKIGRSFAPSILSKSFYV